MMRFTAKQKWNYLQAILNTITLQEERDLLKFYGISAEEFKTWQFAKCEKDLLARNAGILSARRSRESGETPQMRIAALRG